MPRQTSFRRAGAGLCLAAGLVAAPAALATDRCTSDAMVVFDGSGSMSEVGFNRLDQPRIIDARAAVRRAMPRVAPFRDIGLIVYGPGGVPDGPGASNRPGAVDRCRNVDLRFAPVADAAPRIIAEVEALRPDGETPLTEAVSMAADVLDWRARPGVVVLVTDGKETCGGAPCELAAILAADGADLTVHVIGFKVRGESFDWGNDPVTDEYDEAVSVAQCLADRTGGIYVGTETVDELVGALIQTLGCTVIGRLEPVPAPAG